MAQGLFTRTQHIQGIVQRAWNTPVGTYAGIFDNANQYLSVPNIAAYTLSADFTIEFWANATSYPSIGGGSNSPLSGTNTLNNWLILVDSATIAFYWNQGEILSTGVANVVGSWFHVAIVRSGSTVAIYKNGTRLSSATNSSSFTLTNPLFIGQQNTGVGSWRGQLSNIRIVKGTAVYTSNFAPPVGPLAAITNTSLLTLQNATIVDNSTNAATITNGNSVTTGAAMPFTQLKTPAVDYLVVAGGGGGGIENSGGGGAGGLLQGNLPITPSTAYTITIGAGGAGASNSNFPGSNGLNSVLGSISATGGGGGGSRGAGGNASAASGGSGGGGGSAGLYFSTYPGATSAGGQGVTGQGNPGGTYISGSPTWSGAGGGGAGSTALDSNINFATNGGAGIASDITGTRTAYAGGGGGGNRGTSLVGIGGAGGGGRGANDTAATSGSANTGGGGGGGGQATAGGTGGSGIVILSYPDIYAGAAATTGSPTVSTSGSGSWYYPNSTAKVTYSSSYNSAWSFGTGDFTVEGYCYLTSGSSSTIPMFDARSGATGSPWVLNVGTSTNQTYFYNGTLFYSSINIAYNTWNHIAVTRQSGTLKIWINGAQGYTGTVTANLDATGPLNIGDVIQTGQNWLGYLSNMRIVKGTSLYNSAFTPSTIPLTAVSGTTFLNGAVSGSPYLDFSTTNAQPNSGTTLPAWNQLSPFATGLGYKNRVYTWTSSGTVTF